MRIPKALYDKAASWMADTEDTCLLEEQMPKENVNQYLLDEAFEVMEEIYTLYREQVDGPVNKTHPEMFLKCFANPFILKEEEA